jgi:hypothetical protein
MRIGLKNPNLKNLCKFDDHEKKHFPSYCLHSNNFYYILQRI